MPLHLVNTCIIIIFAHYHSGMIICTIYDNIRIQRSINFIIPAKQLFAPDLMVDICYGMQARHALKRVINCGCIYLQN